MSTAAFNSPNIDLRPMSRSEYRALCLKVLQTGRVEYVGNWSIYPRDARDALRHMNNQDRPVEKQDQRKGFNGRAVLQ